MQTSTPSITMRAVQFVSLPRSPRAFEGDRSVGTRLSSQAGRHLLMGMAIETLWWCWLSACCALLDSHFLTNLTCVAFCYLARTSCSGRVDYSPNVKEGYSLPSFLKESRKLSDCLPCVFFFSKITLEGNDITVGCKCLHAGKAGLKIK